MQPLVRNSLALALGAAGGGLFWMLKLPLPWMLGALFLTMTAAVGGLPVMAPARIRPVVVAIIGILLGARFTPEILAQAGVWSLTLAMLLVYLVVVGAVVVPFYHFIGKFDWITAFFAGMPGGLTEMIEIGEAKGAVVAEVIMAHSLRIVMTISLIALWFRVILGVQVGSPPGTVGSGLTALDAALLLGAAITGSLLGRALRFPAPSFLGPLAVSGALHLTGMTESTPPGVLVNAAQVVLGTMLGCRFVGTRLSTLRRAGVLSLGATCLTLGFALLTGWVMRAFAGIGMEQALLALAPGGLTEMGLIALAVHADAAFVALHHVVRILIVIVLAPPVFSRLMPKGRPGR